MTPNDSTTTSSKSIAVLPFSNDSGDSSQRYFSDGLSEDLILALNQYHGLTVIGRESSFQFRGKDLDSRSIGEKLGVAHLLEGSVSREGDMVRVRAELVDTHNGHLLWSEHYDRPYKNLFALQDDITKAVATALEPKLLGIDDSAAVVQTDRPPSGNMKAYQAYLEGNFYYNQFNIASYHNAIEAYNQAIQIDPKYAAAYAGLSNVWILIGTAFATRKLTISQYYAKARSSVNTALKLDPDLATVQIAHGLFLMTTFDWHGAVAAYQRALKLAPGNANAKSQMATLLAAIGRQDKALPLAKNAVAANPLNAISYFTLLRLFETTGQFAAAVQTCEHAISLNPSASALHAVLAGIDVQRGKPKAALKAAQAEPDPFWKQMALTLAYQAVGETERANKALQSLITKYANNGAYQIAEVYAYRGDPDQAFAWLDRAWRQRDSGIIFFLNDPFLLRYKQDPRFAAFRKKVGLPAPGSNGTAQTVSNGGDNP